MIPITLLTVIGTSQADVTAMQALHLIKVFLVLIHGLHTGGHGISHCGGHSSLAFRELFLKSTSAYYYYY